MANASAYPKAIERVVDSGMGATEFMLSQGNQNNPYPPRMPDTEGCRVDGNLSDNFPASVCCSVTP